MVINFHDMDNYVLPITESWDHKNLNEHPDFKGKMCTAEVMAEILFKRIKADLMQKQPALFLREVVVFENDRSAATYKSN